MKNESNVLNVSEISDRGGRTLWIDVLRGFTMLLVIYSHIDIMENNTTTAINQVLLLVRMPLFFFISGFFMYSGQYDKTLLKNRIKNRLIKQLYPTVLFFIAFVVVVYDGRLWPNITYDYKAGYWFTFVSVEYFFVVASVLYCCTIKKVSIQHKTVFFLGVIFIVSLGAPVLVKYTTIFNSKVSGFFSFYLFLRYLPFLLLGCLAKMHWPVIENRLNGVVFSICLLSFVCCAMCNHMVTSFIASIFGIIVMLILFKSFVPPRGNNNKIVRTFTIIGASTLEIYLLHYFVIYVLKGTDLFNKIILTFRNTVYELPIYLTLSFLIASVCIVVVVLLKQIGLKEWIFPSKKRYAVNISKNER